MYDGTTATMVNEQQRISQPDPQRIRLTAHLTLIVYDALTEIQRRHRIKYGRALPIWKVLDVAIRAYAEGQGIQAGE